MIIRNDGLNRKPSTDDKNHTINWDIPEGYKGLAYSVGLNNYLNRLLCKKQRDIMKKKLKPKVIDRYPP